MTAVDGVEALAVLEGSPGIAAVVADLKIPAWTVMSSPSGSPPVGQGCRCCS
jgi:hypothetical protein